MSEEILKFLSIQEESHTIIYYKRLTPQGNYFIFFYQTVTFQGIGTDIGI